MKPRPNPDAQIIKLAILAVGGQGGGVLTNWVETLARDNGYVAQATSVAGVAQRTGTTVYYVEMAPESDAIPVFSLAPAAGDVDVVVAAEMMEAGRAVLRGFVTPDRTTLVASTHRALAVSEKSEPGNGILDTSEIYAAAEIAARQLVLHDLEHLALSNGSVISASLFGALAGAQCLPFDKAAFERAITSTGKAVESSLRAFRAAYDLVVMGGHTVDENPPATPPLRPKTTPQGPRAAMQEWQELQARITQFPDPVQPMAHAGLCKVVDFLNPAYGACYLDKIDMILRCDHASSEYRLTISAAKYIANAMAYDDVIRVADLKTRAARFARIETEMKVKDAQLLHLTEFMHPRAEEIAGMMPLRFGRWLEARPTRMARLDKMFNKGRRLRSDGIGAFTLLYMLAGLRTYRLRTLRHAIEMAHLEHWLATAMDHEQNHYDLAVQVVNTRRLIKGYSDTHSRGLSKFDRVLSMAAPLQSRPDGADWMARLITAALQDEEGVNLDGAIKTLGQIIEIP